MFLFKPVKKREPVFLQVFLFLAYNNEMTFKKAFIYG
jgi:hypothetical protein